MEQFQIDIINSMVNTLKLAGEQFFEWLSTGRVQPSSETTSTSLIDLGTGGTSIAPPITEVQGGSRGESPGSYIPNLQSYEAWLEESGYNDRTPPPAKKYIKTRPVPYTYNPRRASAPVHATKEQKDKYIKEEKTRLTKNVANLSARIWNNMVVAKKLQQGINIRGRKHSLSAKPLQQLHDLSNQMKDLQKKMSNQLIQYKNALKYR